MENTSFKSNKDYVMITGKGRYRKLRIYINKMPSGKTLIKCQGTCI